MSSKNVTSDVVSVDEQAFEHPDEAAIDEDGFEVVDDTPEFQATVEMETQAKVDSNHPDARGDVRADHIYGKTLEQEERIEAREAELEHINAQAALGRQNGRAERTRAVIIEQCGRDEPATKVDPRKTLSQADLAQVNTQAIRIDERVRGGYTRAVVGKRLAERVEDGQDVTEAVLETLEEQKSVPGVILPIADVPEVSVGEVAVEGTVTTLWEPSTANIQQVGLIEDDSGRIKFTSWVKSGQPIVREGQTVRFRAAAKNWYQGRCSIALTGWSRVEFPECGRWWDA